MNNLRLWIEKLQNSSDIKIVEGIKDKAALEFLGISNIITLNKPLFQIAEYVSKKTTRCILLVDLDRQGKILYSKLKKDLQSNGVTINDSYRNYLYKNTELKNIEGLITYCQKDQAVLNLLFP